MEQHFAYISMDAVAHKDMVVGGKVEVHIVEQLHPARLWRSMASTPPYVRQAFAVPKI